METGYDIILKMLMDTMASVGQNPYAVIAAVVLLFVSFGFIVWQKKKAADNGILSFH